MSAEAVLAGNPFGVARTLALGTDLVGKHHIVGPTSTSPPSF